MKQDGAGELDRVLDGLGVIKQVPERIRGAPRPDRVDALVEAAMAKDKGELAAAIIVGFGMVLERATLYIFGRGISTSEQKLYGRGRAGLS